MADLRGGTTIAGYIAWHAGNMGAGSLLDTDLFDGIDSPNFVQNIIDMSDTTWVKAGTETDNLTEVGSAIIATTSTSASVTLASVVLNKLKLGNHSVMIRLKSANNALTTDAIKIEVQKNIGGTFTTQNSLTLKATDFPSTSDYKCFYCNFEYKGGKATNNEVKILVTLLTQASAYKVSLDYIQVVPVTLGVFV
jgi:hypothetical protein